jgi:hypothetical protein
MENSEDCQKGENSGQVPLRWVVLALVVLFLAVQAYHHLVPESVMALASG